MKLYLQRFIAASMPINTQVASFKCNPESLVNALLNKPVTAVPAPYSAGTLSPFYVANGGYKTPGSGGIRFNKAGATIPFTLNYYRISAVWKMVSGTLGPGAVNNTLRGLWTTVSGTRSELSDRANPYGITSAGERSVLPFVLNVTPANSSRIELSTPGLLSVANWDNGFTILGYTNQSQTPPTFQAMESAWNSDKRWDNGYVTDNTVATTNVKIAASACEYYEIEIDDAQLPQVASAATAVYLIVPFMLGTALVDADTTDNSSTFPITSPATNAAPTELIIPVNLIGTGAFNTVNYPSTSGQAADTTHLLGFQFNYSGAVAVQPNAFGEITLAAAPITTGVANS